MLQCHNQVTSRGRRTMSDSLVIASARRTPIGAFQGVLTPIKATELRGGCRSRGVGGRGRRRPPRSTKRSLAACWRWPRQAPARQAALAAGVPASVPATTVNKMCGSGHEGRDARRATRSSPATRASSSRAGLESMSNAPYLLLKARGRLPHGSRRAASTTCSTTGCRARGTAQSMGCFAEATAEQVRLRAQRPGCVRQQSPYDVPVRAIERRRIQGRDRARSRSSGRKGDEIIDRDETPFTLDISRIPRLKPAFRKDGTVTAASSSSISDGAAALVIAASGGGGDGARAASARAHPRVCEPCAGTGMVHDRARAGDPQGGRSRRLVAQRTSTCSRSTRPSPA